MRKALLQLAAELTQRLLGFGPGGDVGVSDLVWASLRTSAKKPSIQDLQVRPLKEACVLDTLPHTVSERTKKRLRKQSPFFFFFFSSLLFLPISLPLE